jgi:hypothetical protein
MVFFSDQQEAELQDIPRVLQGMTGITQWPEYQELDALIAGLQAKKPAGEEQTIALQEEIRELQAKRSDLIPAERRGEWEALRSRRAAIKAAGRRTMIAVAAPARPMRILPRGNWLDDSGDPVTPAVPEFMGKIHLAEGQPATRLDLAKWLTDPERGAGGLTARVIANRLWYLFFGTGISPSLADFGGQGQPPSNPALLDNLAVSFYSNGWDIKALVRLLVTSRAYRQSSTASAELQARDPYNQLLARQSRYRLPAELIRDNALAVSRLLVHRPGGASVKPYQPPGYYRHLNFPVRTYQADAGEDQWRRGIYVHWQRMFLHPMMKAMDAPSREECTAQRPRSNTPTAALVLLNDPTFVEAARVLAERILAEGGSSIETRLDFAYRVVLTRSPRPQESEIFRSLLKSTRAAYDQSPEAAVDLVSSGSAPASTGFSTVELASWTAVARGLMNLNETNFRN